MHFFVDEKKGTTCLQSHLLVHNGLAEKGKLFLANCLPKQSRTQNRK